VTDATELIELRLRLKTTGYAPLPLNGKRPAIDKWQTKADANIDEIRLWAKLYPYSENTGILTKFTPALDIDILNEPAARAAEDLARDRYEEKGYFPVRIGKPPKWAFLFRTDEPFAKITVPLIAPGGREERLEFLCDGQQLACFGIHPDTRLPYGWHGGEPGKIPRGALAYIHPFEARKLVEDIVDLLIACHGYRPKVEAKANGKAQDGGFKSDGADWSKFGYLLDHDNLAAAALMFLNAGMHKGALYNLLRTQLEAIETPDLERKQRRLAELRDVVDSAEKKAHAKAASGGNGAAPQPITLH
jgi:hypothetical protein